MTRFVDFGKYDGRPWEEVPDWYLKWCIRYRTDGSGDFNLNCPERRRQCFRELIRRMKERTPAGVTEATAIEQN
jgi:hypothetical protein